MADETREILIDVEVQTDAQAIASVNEELEDNRKLIRDLKKDYSENSEEIAKLELRNRELSKTKRDLIKASETEANSLNALRLRLAQLTKERNNLDTSIEGNSQRFAELQKEIKSTSDEIKAFEEEGGDFRRNVGNYGNAVNKFGGALKGLGLAAIIGLIAKLGEAFLRNQKVVDTLTTAVRALEIVIDDLVSFVVDNSDSLVDFFSKPLPSVEELGQSIQDGIINRFNQLAESAELAARALLNLFRGNLDEALSDAKQAGVELVDVLTGKDGTFEAIKQVTSAVVDYGSEVLRTARAITELENQSRLNEARQQRVIQQLERQSELQRQIRDDESRGFTERIAANERLGQILNEQSEIELELLETRVKLARLNVEQNANIENQIALQEALLAQEDALNRIEGQRSEQLTNRIALEKERQEQLEEFREFEAQFEKERLEAQEEEAKESARIAEQRKNANIQAQEQLTGAVINLVGQQSQAGKALALSQVVADSARGVSGAIAAGAGIPFPGNLAAIATGVAAVLSGIAQATSILSQSTPSGVSGSSSVVSDSAQAITGQINQASIIQPQLLSQFSQPVQQQQDLINAAGSQPQVNSVVSVVDIKKGLEANEVTVNESSL